MRMSYDKVREIYFRNCGAIYKMLRLEYTPEDSLYYLQKAFEDVIEREPEMVNKVAERVWLFDAAQRLAGVKKRDRMGVSIAQQKLYGEDIEDLPEDDAIRIEKELSEYIRTDYVRREKQITAAIVAGIIIFVVVVTAISVPKIMDELNKYYQEKNGEATSYSYEDESFSTKYFEI